MPLDPSIFLRGADIKAQQDAQLGNTIAGIAQNYTARKDKQDQMAAQGLDLDKLIDPILVKVKAGEQLTPQDIAVAKAWDMKNSTKISTDPTTGNFYRANAPLFGGGSGLDLASLSMPDGTIPGPTGGESSGSPIVPGGPVDLDFSELGGAPVMGADAFNQQYPKGDGSTPRPPSGFDLSSLQGMPQQPAPFVNEYDQLYNQALQEANGNPKLQQTIKADHLKDKMAFNDAQSKAASFADRMGASNPIIADPEKQKSGQSLIQRGLDKIPGGNFLVSDDYQQFSQAERDFINAQLRRESGAVISPEEFANAKLQYFPQPGDDDAVLKQKEQNRNSVLSGMQRSAGPAYKPTNVIPPKKEAKKSLPTKGKIVGGYVFTGGDPAQESSWKKVK